jgi:ADP-ribose pyrophosphatase YjhB (NUDIX family)
MNYPQIHSIQAAILRDLTASEALRFAELNTSDVPSDQFSYHLRHLLKLGFIEKDADNLYRLSGRGKSRSHLLYANEDGFIEQGFLAVRIVLTKVEHDTTYFLVQERHLVPFKHTLGTPGNKIFFGENIAKAAVRAMKEQTGLVCDMELRGIRHFKDEYEGVCMQDKYFFIFLASNPQGELLESGRTGKNIWMTYDEIKASGRSIHGGLDILDTAQSKQLTGFSENTFQVSAY